MGQQANNKTEKVIKNLKEIFSGPQGDEALQFLMARFHVINGTYSDNPNQMYFREGQRAVVLEIIEMVGIDLNKYNDLFSKTQDEFSTQEENSDVPI